MKCYLIIATLKKSTTFLQALMLELQHKTEILWKKNRLNNVINDRKIVIEKMDRFRTLSKNCERKMNFVRITTLNRNWIELWHKNWTALWVVT